ncbi:hypothetical protein UFOVP1090_5 [uncultured Caudovirales phage]|uniref:Uncharacterized protein n=1 Tax=uncultured Caudovirales phage TaxID=2100421 RepID=A0A6J5QDL3_9CAUD|nr:hypothetical protein UFOVP1090_5 [uncultured Caudovirales phage]
MAEKSTKKAQKPADVAPAAVATQKAVKAAKPKTVDIFKFLKPVAEGDKLAPQARVIVNVLSEHAANGLNRDDLVTALVGKLNTRQPESRILTYYQKTLAEGGYIQIEQTEVAAEVAAA